MSNSTQPTVKDYVPCKKILLALSPSSLAAKLSNFILYIYIAAHRKKINREETDIAIFAFRNYTKLFDISGDFRSSLFPRIVKGKSFLMGRWMKPEVYPLLAAMTFVTSMCVFQLSRNLLLNPDVRINKTNRRMGVLENKEEGEKYAEHGLRRFLRTRPPEIMPAINHFFSEDK